MGSERMGSTTIVVAAFNEGEVVGKVVSELVALGYRVVVVDDCSSDETSQIAATAGATVLRHVVNLGQGAALQTGMQYAVSTGAQFVVTFDADGQHQAADVGMMVEQLALGDFDVVLGSRFVGGAAAVNIPGWRRLVLRIATVISRSTTGLNLTDTHNGLRAFTAQAASKLEITQNRMAHASQILSQIAGLKLRYREWPVKIVYTEYSLKKGQRLSNAFNVVWESLFGFFRL